jgi:hypothetical protein
MDMPPTGDIEDRILYEHDSDGEQHLNDHGFKFPAYSPRWRQLTTHSTPREYKTLFDFSHSAYTRRIITTNLTVGTHARSGTYGTYFLIELSQWLLTLLKNMSVYSIRRELKRAGDIQLTKA